MVMEEKDKPGGPHFVGKREELIKAKRTFRTLEGRDILIIHQDGFYAIDSYCYRECSSCQTEHKQAASSE